MIAKWKVETLEAPSRCGFCDRRLATWRERADHLARHFHQGKTMADWRGDHNVTLLV